jgi:hypothetical protein
MANSSGSLSVTSSTAVGGETVGLFIGTTAGVRLLSGWQAARAPRNRMKNQYIKDFIYSSFFVKFQLFNIIAISTIYSI